MTVVDNNLSFAFGRDNGTVVVRVSGELDNATAVHLRSHLVDVIDGQGNLSVTLDLADLTFIDSTGLSALVDAQRRLRDRGGELTLRHPRPAISRVFEIVGFDEVVAVTG